MTSDRNIAVLLQAVGMQGAHHLAGGVEVRGEIVHAKQGHGCQQADLPGAVHVGMFLVFFG